MKQLLQNLKTGNILIEEVPIPNCGPNEVLIRTERTLISPGTERMLVEFGRSGYIQKAKQQPDKVKMVLNKIKTDGLLPTIETVFAKLDAPLPLGYCNAGTVIKVGNNVNEFKIGDRVVSNGNHAEIVCVGKNLVAKIPDNVSIDQASFTVIASIALQGIRIAQPSLGETFVVIGLGLIGQITMELLRVNGCEAIGIDIDENKVQLALERGFTSINSTNINPVDFILNKTDGIGVDGVIITAATKSNTPIEQSAEMCRKKGRIVAVGAIKMDIPRPPFYEKELAFYISTSYGPGRYDPLYEEKGIDYPIGYVRWTEKRNFSAILDLLSSGRLDFSHLISERFKFEDAPEAYSKILNNRQLLGVLLEYPPKNNSQNFKETIIKYPNEHEKSSQVKIGVIGAGNFTNLIILPNLKKQKINLVGIASAKGLSAAIAAKKYGFSFSTTDTTKILEDPSINTIFITTRHNSHAHLVTEALKNGKHVFVEKPLALNIEELAKIVKTINHLKSQNKLPALMVGFNRRFSSFAKAIKNILQNRSGNVAFNFTVNAGHIPADHWIHDPQVGGGRIIGEGCHFIDLLSFLISSKVIKIQSTALGKQFSANPIQYDNVLMNLTFADGSVGTIQYLANGNKSFPKERLLIFFDNKVIELDNFKQMKGFGVKSLKKLSQDKGHSVEISEFINNLQQSNGPLISLDSMINTTLATFAHVRSLKENRTVEIKELETELASYVENN